MTSAAETLHYGACNLCEAICGLEFKIRDGVILSIKGDDQDPLSRGHICPKAVALKDIHEDPDRLRRPLKRSGKDWAEIGWDEAFDLVAGRLKEIQSQHGSNAVAVYAGNPSVHNYGNLTHGVQLTRLLKTRNRFSATSVDQLPHQLVAYWMYGHQFLLPIPDIERTQYFLVLGANPMASNGSLMTVPDFRGRLKELQARGGKMVVIDPRRTETAEVADEHLFIRPGSDAALLFALLNTLFDEGLANLRQLADFTDGMEEVRTAVAGFTPERVAGVTGIKAGDIRRIAREFAAADGAAVYGRIGLSIQPFGALCQWAIQLLNIATGNLDRIGGTLLTRPAADLIASGTIGPGHFGAWKSRVSGRPEFAGELPVAVLAEEILTPGEGQIRALVTVAGNPVLSTPNGGQLDRAFAQLDFMVSLDFYLNETTRHAHVILPPTCGVEHDHYDLIFHHLAVHNTTRYSPPLVAKPAGTLHDWEIMAELGSRLTDDPTLKARLRLRPDQMLDIALRSGPYGSAQGLPMPVVVGQVAAGALLEAVETRVGLRPMVSRLPAQTVALAQRFVPGVPKGHEQSLSLAKLKQYPHGIDLGALEPSLPQRLGTKDKRVRCAIPELLADLPRLERALFAPGTANGLQLIGRRHVRSNNSWMHNSARLVKGKARHQLLMHPDDLSARGLSDGRSVRVRSRVGEVVVEVQASDTVMKGVVSLPHGWGHAREGVRLSVAREHAGVSINDLTDDRFLDELSGNAALNGTPVTVEAA
ncbi:MAG: molybdopterin oxidoreductase family protein [Nevskiales bacterium]